MIRHVWIYALSGVVTFLSTSLLASDVAKEKRWADQIIETLFEGEAEWLKAGTHEFLAIYTEAEDAESRQAAIILHGIGVHPDWPQVVYPLRTKLAELGWSTLSVQMPILSNDANTSDYYPLFEEVAPRLDASIRFLEGKGSKKIVLIGHSLGAAMATHYLAENKTPIRAFVGVGMTAGSGDPRMDNAESLKRIHIPVLDIYGSNDLRGVVDYSSNRASAAKMADNPSYRQVEVEEADHFFDGKEQELVDTVNSWLVDQTS
jgi:pimeloyl-ACP methyl ester carboxylesterase